MTAGNISGGSDPVAEALASGKNAGAAENAEFEKLVELTAREGGADPNTRISVEIEGVARIYKYKGDESKKVLVDEVNLGRKMPRLRPATAATFVQVCVVEPALKLGRLQMAQAGATERKRQKG